MVFFCGIKTAKQIAQKI